MESDKTPPRSTKHAQRDPLTPHRRLCLNNDEKEEAAAEMLVALSKDSTSLSCHKNVYLTATPCVKNVHNDSDNEEIIFGTRCSNDMEAKKRCVHDSSAIGTFKNIVVSHTDKNKYPIFKDALQKPVALHFVKAIYKIPSQKAQFVLVNTASIGKETSCAQGSGSNSVPHFAAFVFVRTV